MDGQTSAPWLLSLRSSSPWIVMTVSFAIFTDVFLYGVIIPVLPFSLVDRLHVPKDDVQYWVSVSLAIFAAALLISAPTWGYIADRIQNRRLPMLFGLVLLLGTSLFLCFSTNIAMMLVGRILQGMSAGMIWSVGLALVIDTVDSKHVGEAMGWISTGLSLGLLTAPSVGGIVYGKSGYYPVFITCFALVAIDIVFRVSVIEVKEARKWILQTEDGDDVDERSRLLGNAANNTVQPTSVVSDRGQQETGMNNHGDPEAMGLMHLLCKPRLLAALWGTVIESSINTSFDSTLPLFVSSTFGWGSLGAGLIFLPLVLPMFLGPVVGAISDRCGPKWLSSGGFIVSAPFLIALGYVTDDSVEHQVLLCLLLLGVGLCMTFVIGPLMAEITWSIQEDSHDFATVPYALAYGLYTVAFSCGAILGPIMGGIIRDNHGWGAVGLCLGIVAITSAVVHALWTGGPLGSQSVE